MATGPVNGETTLTEHVEFGVRDNNLAPRRGTVPRTENVDVTIATPALGYGHAMIYRSPL